MNEYHDELSQLSRDEGPVMPKSVPPKIGPAGSILAEKPTKTGPKTTFAAKIGLAGLFLAAKSGPPKRVTLINFMCVHDCLNV